MDWYWWVIIVAGVLLLGYLKIKLFNSIKKKPKDQDNHHDED